MDGRTEHPERGLRGNVQQGADLGGLHAAIWHITTGPLWLGSGQTEVARGYFLGLAGQNGGGFSTEGWYVLSEADVSLSESRSGQEYLMKTVPEPSTYLLMATGLLLLVGFGRRRLGDLTA